MRCRGGPPAAQQFPRRYLRALVRAGVRHDTRGSGIIEAASAAYGRVAVLHGLVDAAIEGLLSHSTAMLLASYAREARWRKPSARPRRQAVAEYDLMAELIRITSGGTVRWLRERPSGDD